MASSRQNIKDATFDVAVDDKTTFIGKVMMIGEKEEYDNKQGEKRTFLTVSVADEPTLCRMKVYKKSIDNLQEGKSYKFENVIGKFGGFWCVANSRITTWAPIKYIPPNIEEEARPVKHVENKETTLKYALQSPATSTIKGKVVK